MQLTLPGLSFLQVSFQLGEKEDIIFWGLSNLHMEVYVMLWWCPLTLQGLSSLQGSFQLRENKDIFCTLDWSHPWRTNVFTQCLCKNSSHSYPALWTAFKKCRKLLCHCPRIRKSPCDWSCSVSLPGVNMGWSGHTRLLFVCLHVQEVSSSRKTAIFSTHTRRTLHSNSLR